MSTSIFNSPVFNAALFNGGSSGAPALLNPLAIDDRAFEPLIADTRNYVMAKRNVRIRVFVTGDTWRIRRTYTGLETGITISKIYLTIKANQTDADPGLIQKSVTTTQTSSGQITDATTTDGQIAFYIDVSKTESLLLTPGQEYYYDLQGIGSDGAVYTFETGLIIPQRGVTDASS